jgi:hypothetical protein
MKTNEEDSGLLIKSQKIDYGLVGDESEKNHFCGKVLIDGK